MENISTRVSLFVSIINKLSNNFDKRPHRHLVTPHGGELVRSTLVGCMAQWWNAGLRPANFSCFALDLQLMGDYLCE